MQISGLLLSMRHFLLAWVCRSSFLSLTIWAHPSQQKSIYFTELHVGTNDWVPTNHLKNLQRSNFVNTLWYMLNKAIIEDSFCLALNIRSSSLFLNVSSCYCHTSMQNTLFLILFFILLCIYASVKLLKSPWIYSNTKVPCLFLPASRISHSRLL